MDKSLEFWDKTIKNLNPLDSCYDGWLNKYFDGNFDKNTTVIELGCGWGDDTSFLAKTECKIASCDFSAEAINVIKILYPSVKLYQFNFLETFPFESNSANVIIGDLCLHYFNDQEMAQILGEIQRVLVDDGLFLCRLNSNQDINFGAGQGIEISEGIYESDAGVKRYFDYGTIMRVFKEFRINYINEYILKKYSKDKIVWEIGMTICTQELVK
ncbi:MAG: class I SAM-dependent methyltransferase [Bacteroidota bacterium]